MKALFNILLLLTLTCLSMSTKAQGWQQSFGDSENDYGSTAVELADGNFYILFRSGDINSFLKTSPSGDFLSYDTIVGKTVKDMEILQNGDFMIYGTKTDEEFDRPFLTRYDPNGVELWTQVYKDTSDYDGQNYFTLSSTYDFVELLDGNIIFHASYGVEAPDVFDVWGVTAFKVTESGDLIWKKSSSRSYNKVLLSNGNILVTFRPLMWFSGIAIMDSEWENVLGEYVDVEWDGSSYAATASGGGFVVCDNIANVAYKFDGSGTLLDEYPLEGNFVNKMILQPDNSFLCLGPTNDAINSPIETDFFLQKAFPPTNIGWQSRKYFKPLSQTPLSILPTSDGGYLMTGSTASTLTGSDAYVIKVDENGLMGGHLLSGTIRYDLDQDCTLDITEEGLSGFVVIADGPQTNYSITNEFGDYEMEVLPGSYDVSAIPKNQLWSNCSDSLGGIFINQNDTTIIDFEMQAIVECPYLEVNIGTQLLRRCFENTYVVSYCNNGTAIAENTSIAVILDDLMEVVSTSIPTSFSIDSLYVFDIGVLDISECGSFTINVLLDPDCTDSELGSTHCVSAHISPDTACIVNSGWTGADIELAAECDPDSLSFFIQNNGTGDMNQILNFVIIEDEVIRHEGVFELDAGEFQTEKVPANGSTYRMEAEQVVNHPFNKSVSITVEGCGLNAANEISLGYVNLFPEGDEAPFLSIDCQQNIGAFDPNDKQGFPLGYGDQNYIYQNVAIDYMIRFQNTGTDTAFNIVIVDTLSAYLNPVSVSPGASSHPYRYDLSGNGIASFTFENILLPDSNVNEVLSHGFVKFRINQKNQNPLGTEILNSAAIFFDFNDPIITNTTYHQVGEKLLLTVVVDPPDPNTADVLVYPNPFDEQATFEVKGTQMRNLNLVLFNSKGQLMRTEVFDGNTLQFNKEQLIPGVYFFQIVRGKEEINSGKIIVE